MIERTKIQVSGVVQSVGFRPFIYSLALRHGLFGFVRNNEKGVVVELEGKSESIERFLTDLRSEPPVLAQIETIECSTERELAHYRDFQIIENETDGKKLVPISPDISTCSDCLAELFDTTNRRFRYPFINCTNCGPRFTIIEDIPYDRATTTMREFEMCEQCRNEYRDPLNRRFHAEPTACPECGPNVALMSVEQELIAVRDDAIAETVSALNAGKIIAIKGIGGFHLACYGLNEEAVRRLRERKYREDKPFALMARSYEVVAEHCEISKTEKDLLASRQRPIVLLRRRSDSPICEAVAPRVKTLGFMLPYTPLHHLLLEHFDQPLVMTSANISDEPICYQDEEAQQRLQKIADYYLTHDRRIYIRTDDSVARVFSDESHQQTMILRRSRGYAPAPLNVGTKFDRQILACGAELKNTFCFARSNSAFLSHHIGDLENLETLHSFKSGIDHFKRLFAFDPEVVAYDLHPEYLSTKYALTLDDVETKIGVQHHHAHIVSCMADNQIEGDVIGVAMDGLGFGSDGRLWGGEFFICNAAESERVAHLDYIPMPGGAKAIKEPWRMAAAYLHQTFGEQYLDLDIAFTREINVSKSKTLNRMIESGSNSPQTSSMGRLFDAVSSLLRLRDFTNYEGQAAIELEQIADEHEKDGYIFEVSEGGLIVAEKLVREIVTDLLNGVSSPAISGKFHQAVAKLIVSIALNTRERCKLNRVVMSGGVFQNALLLSLTKRKLRDAGFEVWTHHRVPTNDGGISLGQAVIANARLKT